ncbi:CARDB domain-containing protein [Halobellus captivus]|uniref:CARDB domain-containing protein n=1 Tax=Halobellus captivus TaxID=2592614 RepID=UPI0013969285|nr:CARDB domain-containing protein [Halobellus captivus]
MPVKAGETVEVTVTVLNSGNATGEKEVWFHLDQYYKDDAQLELAPGESETVTLTYVSKSENAKDWTLRVDTPDDRHEETVTIEKPAQHSTTRSSGGGSDGHPHFDIVDMTVEEPITAGDPLRMSATVENTGRDLGEKLVWFTVDGETVNETIIELPEGHSTTVTAEYNTSIEAAGEHLVTANTSDDVVRRSIEFNEPVRAFEVKTVDTSESIIAGEQLTVTATVENVGDIPATVPVRMTIDGHFIDEERVDVAPNESATVELQYRTNTWTTGEIDVTVGAENASVSRLVTVVEPTPTETTERLTEPESTAEPVDTATTATVTPASQSSWSGPNPGLSMLVVMLFVGALAITRWG